MPASEYKYPSEFADVAKSEADALAPRTAARTPMAWGLTSQDLAPRPTGPTPDQALASRDPLRAAAFHQLLDASLQAARQRQMAHAAMLQALLAQQQAAQWGPGAGAGQAPQGGGERDRAPMQMPSAVPLPFAPPMIPGRY